MKTPDEFAAAENRITDQMWIPEVRDDGVYLVGADDHTVILKLCRPDRGSDLLVAGYVIGLQATKVLPPDPRCVTHGESGHECCSTCGQEIP